ncbi:MULTISPECIES: hypothetical protein [unclassified Anaeromyxobacter]|uniref:hypothetical protein n=1 Tax=unclassified Anaeromyxobacter TaxID=2620896 RepID=UPI001F5A9102|nr:MULTISPECIES: hypothetical protein [unclassified Anaeromyxobacter]
MAEERTPKDELGTEPGLAGGPGPKPPGFDDGTPRILGDGSPGYPPEGALEPRDEEVENRKGEPVEHPHHPAPRRPPRRGSEG